MTDTASKINTPEDMNKGRNIPVHEAIAARAPPSARDPVSPINMEAL